MASTESAMGSAWIPAELVSTTGESRISGYSAPPTPAAPECAQRSAPPAARNSSRGMP